MPSDRHDFRQSPPPDKYGLPGWSAPTNDPSAFVIIVEDDPVAAEGYAPLPAYTAHPSTGNATYALAILTSETPAKGDGTTKNVRRVYETLPGPPLITSRIDPEDGSVITETRRPVRTSPLNVATSTSTTAVRYEPRGDNPLVSIEITTATDLSGVVRSSFTRIALDLPRVLAGIQVTYQTNKGEGDDDSQASGTATSSVRFSSSARGSSSLSIIPEVFLPVRDYREQAKKVRATVKQVFLSGALTETALLARLSAIYEAVVSGTLSPAAGGTYTGNSSNNGGVIWFSQGSYNIYYAGGGNWLIGTDAGISAGDYWIRSGATAATWLGTYAPHGTYTGTATVAAGRTVNPPINWGTQEVNLITAGKQVSVSSNASASKDVSTDGVAYSLSLGHGYSVSVGGNQSRVRVEPTLHGELVIANPTYTDSVNATATAGLPAIPLGSSTGTSSGLEGDSHAQTLVSYVRTPSGVRIPPTSPADVPATGLYLEAEYRVSPKDDQWTGFLCTIVDYALLAAAPCFIGYADPAPTYHQSIAIVANYPIFLGGTPASYSISPAIVAGLTFNTTTGIITGSPSIGLSATAYTVTATNAQGTDTAVVTISVAIP